MLVRLTLAPLLAFFLPAAVAAQLVRDINAQPVPGPGYVQSWKASIAAGNLFVADDNVHGEELWISDGTPSGTHLLRDIFAGKSSSEIGQFTVLNGAAYFFANDGVNGRELWRSDGTYAGTHIVANIGPGAQGFNGVESRPLPIVAGNMFFAADDGVHGAELWCSDGTAAGTHIVADIVAGPGSSDIGEMIAAGNRLFFSATDSAGNEPWISDGTAAGTHRVGDINPGPGDGYVGGAVAVNGTVFFSATDPAHGAELWRLKAGEQLASIVADINTELAPNQPLTGPAYTNGSKPFSLTVSGDSVLFTAIKTLGLSQTTHLYRATVDSNDVVPLIALGDYDLIYQMMPVGARGAVFAVTTKESPGITTRALFVTDGTAAGSQSLDSQNLWLTGTTLATERSEDGKEVYFFARQPNTNSEVNLWRSDGTVANTRIFAEVNDMTGGWDLRRVGNTLYFVKGNFSDGVGREMWLSDGTPAGTRMIVDLDPGQDSSQPYALQVLGNRVTFAAFTPDDPATFWITDGTAVGTLPLAKIWVDYETQGSGIYSLGAMASAVLYLADDGINGPSLWSSDGTSAGTRLVKDVTPGTEALRTLPMMSLGNVQIFNDGDIIWRTDGTTAGTYSLGDTAPGTTGEVYWPVNGQPSSVIGNIGYFFANDGVHNTLWRTDGTTAGTTMVTDVTAKSPGVLGIAGAVGSRLLFLGVNGSNSGTLYSTDGTPGGTVQVSPNHQLGGNVPRLFKGRMCFSGNDGVPHVVPGGSFFRDDVWCSNGSAGDMVRVTHDDADGRSAGDLFVVDDLLFVNSYGQDATSGLWITDGDPATSRQLLTEHASEVVRYGSQYLIAASDDPAGPRLWLSDGTTAGTRDLLQGANVDGTLTGQFTVFANYVMFNVRNANGVVIWRTDGTPAGTRFVADVNPSTSDIEYPLDFRVLGNKLLFVSPHPQFADELWMLTAINPNATEDALQVPYQTATVANVLVNDADIDGTLDAASVEVVEAPVSGSAEADGTGKIQYTPGAGFTGIDSFTYRVRDNQGNWSNAAKVSILVDQPVGADPAAAPANLTPAPQPVPPTSSPPPVTNPPASPPSGGGGGALGSELVLLGLLALARCGGRKREGRARC